MYHKHAFFEKHTLNSQIEIDIDYKKIVRDRERWFCVCWFREKQAYFPVPLMVREFGE